MKPLFYKEEIAMKKFDIFDFIDVVCEIIHDAKDEHEVDDRSARLVALILNQGQITKESLDRKKV